MLYLVADFINEWRRVEKLSFIFVIGLVTFAFEAVTVSAMVAV